MLGMPIRRKLLRVDYAKYCIKSIVDEISHMLLLLDTTSGDWIYNFSKYGEHVLLFQKYRVKANLNPCV